MESVLANAFVIERVIVIEADLESVGIPFTKYFVINIYRKTDPF